MKFTYHKQLFATFTALPWVSRLPLARASPPSHFRLSNITRTTSSFIVESIGHDTDWRYKSAIWWLKAGSTTSSSNRQERTLYQQNVAFPCKNKNSTVGAGTTAGTIVHQGKTYYARLHPPTITLNCGV